MAPGLSAENKTVKVDIFSGFARSGPSQIQQQQWLDQRGRIVAVRSAARSIGPA